MTAPPAETPWARLYSQLKAAVSDGDQAAAAELIEQLHTAYLAEPHATTPGGLPYPLPTDPLAEGADAFRALAEAVDARDAQLLTAGGAGGTVSVSGTSTVSVAGLVTVPAAAWPRMVIINYRTRIATGTVDLTIRRFAPSDVILATHRAVVGSAAFTYTSTLPAGLAFTFQGQAVGIGTASTIDTSTGQTTRFEVLLLPAVP